MRSGAAPTVPYDAMSGAPCNGTTKVSAWPSAVTTAMRSPGASRFRRVNLEGAASRLFTYPAITACRLALAELLRPTSIPRPERIVRIVGARAIIALLASARAGGRRHIEPVLGMTRRAGRSVATHTGRYPTGGASASRALGPKGA